MRKVYFVILVCVCFWDFLAAQTVKWSKLEGSFAYDYGYGIVTDKSANVYVGGKFEGNAIFSGTTLTCRGNHDIYLAKYDSLGNLQWVKTGGGPLGDYAHKISTDGSYIYMCGEIETSGTNDIEFDGYTQKFTGKGLNDAFVAKYDLNGKVLWVQQMAGGDDDKAYGVSSDLAGNVYVSGHFTGTAYFGPNSVPVKSSSSTDRDMFIAKYSPDGKFQWVRSGGSLYREQVYGMVTDSVGNSYVTGAFYDGANFDGTVLHTYNNSGFWDCFLLKYDRDGKLLWARNAGGSYDDVGWGVTMDRAGRIYVAGEFNDQAYFGSSHSLNSNGSADAFIACYDASGNVQWVTGAGGDQIDRIRGIGTDGLNVFVTGQFGSAMTLGSKTLTATDDADIFAAKVNPDGKFGWSLSIGGSPDSVEELGYESGIAITTDNKGNAYFTGAMLDGGTIDGQKLNKYGRTDIFITRLANAATPYYIPPQDTSHHSNGIQEQASISGLRVYPNPARDLIRIVVDKNTDATTKVTLTDILGNELKTMEFKSEINLNLAGLSTGMYFLHLNQQGLVTTKKIILE